MLISRPPASPLGGAADADARGGNAGTKRPVGSQLSPVGPAKVSCEQPQGQGADAALLRTLEEHFGFSGFRAGQLEVVEAVLAGRDAAVFWATGSGKSLCYQLPPLHSKKISVVVSPLISLMMDQVTKFNATVGATRGSPRACFLGSMQPNPGVEEGALAGAYVLVYVTPEKLMSGFLERLAAARGKTSIGLVAVDEAHCISEWGHDFRPAYRGLKSIREKLPGVPIMSLTATAVPRVQGDVIEQLSLQSPQLSKHTFDRPNLLIACARKQNKHADLQRIATLVAAAGSTIVYAPTQAEVDMLGGFLSDRLQAAGKMVCCYHGGKSPAEREEAHLNFLSGRAHVIVATVAFGMGIDKPDIRQIVHYGAPKTVEEYLQQIGRAGRDGLPSRCELVSSDADFGNYSSEFYTKNLTAQAKEMQLKSTNALRQYAAGCSCRRRWLLEYFGEEPSFGERCGTCDACAASVAHAGDLRRDFRAPARMIFEAVASTEDFPQAMTTLLAIISGSWKAKTNFPGDMRRKQAMARIQELKRNLAPVLCREAFVREMFATLSAEGFLERQKKTGAVGAASYQATWEVYVRTAKGRAAHEQNLEIRLQVPQAVRQIEEAERRRAEERKKELEKGGVNLAKIPVEELEAGEGKTIDAQLTWSRRLSHYRENGKTGRAEKLEELLARVLRWRDGVAQRLRMAPASVLSEQLSLSLAYTQPTSAEALRAAGVRLVEDEVEQLAQLLRDSLAELFPKAELAALEGAAADQPRQGGQSAPAQMVLPAGSWTPPQKWDKAVYKPGKGGAPPVWEQYYKRWAAGEHPQAIAMSPPSGKAVQTGTVMAHVFTALTFGRPVDFARIAGQFESQPPNEEQWKRIEEGAAVGGQSVNTDGFRAKEVLCGILGAESVNADFTSKTEEQRAKEAHWYGLIRWWEALKKVQCPVSFGGEAAAKRQRLA